jgi:CRISP-associated protein Cas1
MQLVLDTEGVTLKRQDGCFYVTQGEESRMISPMKITSIVVLSSCLLSAAAVLLAVEHEIPIYFNNAYGKPQARLDSVYFKNLPIIRRQQVLFALEANATAWVVSLFELKKIHQFDNLDLIKDRKSALKTTIEKRQTDMDKTLSDMIKLKKAILPTVSNSLMGLEGTMARYYWQTIADALDDPSVFDKRTRRPAEDSFNATLNYAYGMLYNVVENAVLAAGLDPQLGFLHADDYARPTLVFDMIEPFRPWVDRLLIEQYLTNQVNADYFEAKDGGIFVSAAGKRWLIPLFNAFMLEKCRFQEKQLIRKNHINRFAGEFAQLLLESYNNPITQ